uniref:AB hydrolase-1 domain-containing protein n=1 Tax=Mantoniella antarctica TaxID=81844 RepID=A0A7S0SKE2_9CHLO
MSASIVSAASACPRGVTRRAAPARPTRHAPPTVRGPRVVARASIPDPTPTYVEVFDGQSGQMEKVLSQGVEAVTAGGLDWSFRVGVPADGAAAAVPNKVIFVHGAGLVAFTYSKLMKEMQEAGFQCYAPDMPGHGGTSKPAPGSDFRYDAASYSAALEAFITETGIAAAAPVDLVVSGFLTSQAALLLAAARPALFRRVVVLNAPLGNGHKLPDALGVYNRPFGMGKGAKADVYKLAYFGNEFALAADRIAEYEAPYGGAGGEAARAALEATCIACDLKSLMEQVATAFRARPGPKVRVVWGSSDKYLGDAPMYKWTDDVRASFDCMRKVGHMPQEDFPQETAKFIKAFLESELKVSALGSVRLSKVGKDDDYDRD